jgi:hypothetical protein
MKAMLVAVAAVSMLVGVVVGVLVDPEAVLGGHHSFPKMAKAVYQVEKDTTGLDVGGGVRATDVFCDLGDVLLSGGLSQLDAGTQIEAMVPNPERFAARWRPNGSDTVEVFAYCSDFPPAHQP